MILEFDKYKKLVSPWPITVYGQTITIQLEFDLPKCACFQTINSIQFDLYKKGNVTPEGKLLTFTDFSRIDDTTWGATIPFVSDELKKYLSDFAEGTATLDGQFSFTVDSSKVIKSQVFAANMYEENTVEPDDNTAATLENVKEITDSKITEHNSSEFAHENRFNKIYEEIGNNFKAVKLIINNLVECFNKNISDVFNTLKEYTVSTSLKLTKQLSFSANSIENGGIDILLPIADDLTKNGPVQGIVTQIILNNRVYELNFEKNGSYIEYNENIVHIQFYDQEKVDLDTFENGAFNNANTKIKIVYTISSLS